MSLRSSGCITSCVSFARCAPSQMLPALVAGVAGHELRSAARCEATMFSPTTTAACGLVGVAAKWHAPRRHS
eukprot:1837340-Alexandrium_andersonii.AAC.1